MRKKYLILFTAFICISFLFSNAYALYAYALYDYALYDYACLDYDHFKNYPKDDTVKKRDDTVYRKKGLSDTSLLKHVHEEHKKDSTFFKYVTFGEIEQTFHPDTLFIDSSLTGVQHYQPYVNQPFLYANTGNIGSASRYLIFLDQPNNHFFYSQHAFRPYFIKPEDVKIFSLSSPYTHLFYETNLMGGDKQQIFNVEHAQKIGDRFNIGIDYRINPSIGQYIKQEVKNNHFSSYAQYLSKRKRYSGLFLFTRNKIDANENGGISSDSLFENNIITNRKGMDVLLSADQISKNRILAKDFVYNHHIETNKVDSIGNYKKYEGFGRFGHQIHFFNEAQIYENSKPISGYFENVIYDSLATYDSIYTSAIENMLYWNSSQWFAPFNVFLGMEHQLINNAIFEKDTLIQSFSFYDSFPFDSQPYHKFKIAENDHYIRYIPFFRLSFHNAKISSRLAYKAFYGDYNPGDFDASFAMAYNFSDSLKHKSTGVSLRFSNRKPDRFYQKYYSNHFVWTEDLNKIQTFNVGIHLNMDKFSVIMDLYSVQNYTYLNYEAFPEQLTKTLLYGRLRVNADVKWSLFEFKNNIIIQKSNNEKVFQYPVLLSNHVFVLAKDFFNGALFAQIGMEASVHSSYYGDAYQPAMRMFYLQNEKKIEPYAFINAFMNLKIDRARIFLLYEHFNAGLMGYEYYLVPHYPAYDGVLRAGVSWMFFK